MAKRESNTVKKVYELALPIVEDLKLSLWDVQFEKEGANWILRILIDSPTGIGFEDCEAVSRALDPVLDEENPIEQSYFLEVSSSGIERDLRKSEHYEYAKGKTVSVLLIRPLDGEREFSGILTAYDDLTVTLDTECNFVIADCANIKLSAEI